MFKNSLTSSIVFKAGVCTFSNLLLSSLSCFLGVLLAASILAPYSQEGQTTIVSSPQLATTMNSFEPDPPIAPESAATTLKSRTKRLKTFLYFSSIT